MKTQKEIRKAKQVLKDSGYFTDNLWTVYDVQGVFQCTEDQAQMILDRALTNDATMDQIQFSIREFGEIEGLTKIEE